MTSLSSAVASTATSTQLCIPQPTKASNAHIAGSFTLNDIFRVIAVIALIVTWVNAIFLICTHLVWRANIHEQRASMRIALLPAVFCTFGFFSIFFYGSGSYLDDVAKVYESFTVAAFFNLMVYTITPNPQTRESYYVGLERLHRSKRRGRLHDKGSYRWYRVRSALIYQVPIVSAIVCILNGILFGTVCDTSKEFQLGSTLLAIINFLSQVLALTSIVGYYRRLRPEFRGTPIMRKFLTYKAMVWLIIHQQLILEIIQFAKVVTPTSGTTEYMSYADFKFGIPEFMLCCETLIFSCLFQWSFAAWPHRKALLSSDVETLHTSHAPDRSLFAYVQALLWPQDIFHEQLAAAKTLIGTFKGADSFDYTAGTGVGFSQRFYSKEGSLSDSHRSFDMPAMTPGVEKSHEQHLLSSNANRQSLRIPSVPEDLNSHSPQTPRQHL